MGVSPASVTRLPFPGEGVANEVKWWSFAPSSCVALSDQLTDPSGRPPRFDGAAWVSQDGNYWWNGTAWQPIVRRRQVPWGVIAGVVLIIAAIALSIHFYPRPLIDLSSYGATNAQIDSTTQIEFDYRSQDSCNNLTFIYTFYNQQGFKVSEFDDQQSRQVSAGQTYHFTIAIGSNGQGADPSASRFTVTPTCHD